MAGALMPVGVAVIVQELFASGAAGSVLAGLGAGTLLLFIGIALVSRTRHPGPLASVVGRTAASAAALMIGLALIAFVATDERGYDAFVLLAALSTRALGRLGIGFHLPSEELGGFVLLAVVAGIAAAVLPALRAARLDVLQALEYERARVGLVSPGRRTEAATPRDPVEWGRRLRR